MGGRASLLMIGVLAVGCRWGFDEVNDRDAGPPGTSIDAADVADAAVTDAASLACPGGYITVVNETSRYRLLPGGTNDWLTAEQQCEADGTHLVVLDSANEKTMMITLAPATDLWTGVTDRKTIGQWLRVTGGVAPYLPWASSEPDASAPECVQLEGLSTALRDQGCSSGRRAICECDGLPAMPSTY